jgi:hypothetical protein
MEASAYITLSTPNDKQIMTTTLDREDLEPDMDSKPQRTGTPNIRTV